MRWVSIVSSWTLELRTSLNSASEISSWKTLIHWFLLHSAKSWWFFTSILQWKNIQPLPMQFFTDIFFNMETRRWFISVSLHKWGSLTVNIYTVSDTYHVVHMTVISQIQLPCKVISFPLHIGFVWFAKTWCVCKQMSLKCSLCLSFRAPCVHVYTVISIRGLAGEKNKYH